MTKSKKTMSYDDFLREKEKFLKPYKKAYEKALKECEKAKKKRDEALKVFNIVQDNKSKAKCEEPERLYKEARKTLQDAQTELSNKSLWWSTGGTIGGNARE